ncbi:MAG: glycosyltransferase [Ignavibacteriales bacterium]|nr:glycosyltransferase [Ignavibacteriales bacterium]
MKSYKTQFVLYREIEKYRKEYKINVFIGVYSGILPLYFYLRKKKRKVGIIFSDMDSWFDDVYSDMRKYWYKSYSSFNYALKQADIVDFLSPFILDGLRKKGIIIPEDRISITPCSFTDYSKCKIGDKTKFQVAFASRLEKYKNPEMFLEAALILSKKYPEIIFHIMGEGRLSSSINEKIKSSGFLNIIFYGFHPQPVEILADTSVFVSIQTTNNYPSQSVLEAMACGNVIIANDVGDTRMFINKNNGILIESDWAQLVKGIETLYLNKDLKERLGRFGYSYVRENHTIEKMAEYYSDLFKNVSNVYVYNERYT